MQTTEIFGEPVYTYSYREAVLDGYLIDHDAPHSLGGYARAQKIFTNQLEAFVKEFNGYLFEDGGKTA